MAADRSATVIPGGQAKGANGTVGRKLRFRGESRNKVDGKGRVSIPASFRRVLQAGDPEWAEGRAVEFVLVYGRSNKFLEGLTIDRAEEIERKIARLKSSDENRRRLVRIYSQKALTLSVDDTGRIVLPAILREKFGLNGEAYFASNFDVFRIWNPEVYAEEEGILFDALAEAEDDTIDEDFDPDEVLDEIDLEL